MLLQASAAAASHKAQELQNKLAKAQGDQAALQSQVNCATKKVVQAELCSADKRKVETHDLPAGVCWVRYTRCATSPHSVSLRMVLYMQVDQARMGHKDANARAAQATATAPAAKLQQEVNRLRRQSPISIVESESNQSSVLPISYDGRPLWAVCAEVLPCRCKVARLRQQLADAEAANAALQQAAAVALGRTSADSVGTPRCERAAALIAIQGFRVRGMIAALWAQRFILVKVHS